MEKSTRPVGPEMIYKNGSDLHGVAVLYKGAKDTNVYFDKEGKHQVPDVEMLRLYAHGAMVLVDGVYYKPISYGNKTLTLADTNKTALKAL